MTTIDTAQLWLLLAVAWSVLLGFWLAFVVRDWLDRRRAARRLAEAEAAFWVSLRAFVKRAREDIETPPCSETPIFDALAIERLRADLDSWGRS